MDYLFFDVECAKCRKGGVGALCEIGYVIVDEKFNVLQEKHFLINPLSSFDKYALKNILRYTKEEYESSPTLKDIYAQVRSEFTKKNRLVLGHTTALDVKYLASDVERNKLEKFSYEYYDVRDAFAVLEDEENYTGVKSMLEKLNLAVPESLHNSLTDAKETMLICKELCKKHDKDIKQIIKLKFCKKKVEKTKQEQQAE